MVKRGSIKSKGRRRKRNPNRSTVQRTVQHIKRGAVTSYRIASDPKPRNLWAVKTGMVELTLTKNTASAFIPGSTQSPGFMTTTAGVINISDFNMTSLISNQLLGIPVADLVNDAFKYSVQTVKLWGDDNITTVRLTWISNDANFPTCIGNDTADKNRKAAVGIRTPMAYWQPIHKSDASTKTIVSAKLESRVPFSTLGTGENVGTMRISVQYQAQQPDLSTA